MIIWPDETTVAAMREEGREGLRLFRESAAAAEIEARPERWHIVSWPWTREPPVRIVLESDRHEDIVFSLDADGVWMLSPASIDFHLRPKEALDRDALAEVPFPEAPFPGS
jgi:hypothetical protein